MDIADILKQHKLWLQDFSQGKKADLSDADLRDADLMNAKFYGKGGTKPLKKEQVPVFLKALGFVIEG